MLVVGYGTDSTTGLDFWILKNRQAISTSTVNYSNYVFTPKTAGESIGVIVDTCIWPAIKTTCVGLLLLQPILTFSQDIRYQHSAQVVYINLTRLIKRNHLSQHNIHLIYEVFMTVKLVCIATTFTPSPWLPYIDNRLSIYIFQEYYYYAQP